MANVDRFRVTRHGSLIFYRPGSNPAGTAHELSELTPEHGTISLKRVKGHYNYGSPTPLPSPARRQLKQLGINTLGELVASIESDAVQDAIAGNMCYGGRDFTESAMTELAKYRSNLCDPDFVAPIKLDIVAKGVAGYHQLDGALKEIVQTEVAQRVTHILPEIIRDAEHIKKQRDIKQTQSEIKKLEQRLAVLEMDT